MLDLLGNRERTHHCGELREEHEGRTVFLAGWVARRRDLGSLIFLDLRDHTGVTQIVCNRERSAGAHAKAEDVRPEFVIGVEGVVVRRSAETANAQLPTGNIEVFADALLLLNESKTPPFPIDDAGKTQEETRLRYRFLDLRRARMQSNLRLRHRASSAVREYLSGCGFTEIETPFLTRSTPEGARDYLVPSRIHHGHFYALPQSPQLFKQILMIGGLDRYFQIVRCFRDEDLRADRQPEFTQIDIEMAFPQQSTLFKIIEGLMEQLFSLIGVKLERPFPQLAYDEAMERYGSDKPHTGFGLEWKRLALPEDARGKMNVAEPIKVLRVPGWAQASRSQIDKLQKAAVEAGAEWFATAKVMDEGIQSALAKPLGEATVRQLVGAAGGEAGELLVFLGAKPGSHGPATSRRLDEASGQLRLEIARTLGLLKSGEWHFLWVVSFPMFEYDEKEKRFAAMHHPFTSPREEDLHLLKSDPASVRARAYDLVLNGAEIGGGSIRSHRRDIQQMVFETLGMTEEQARERFGFFLEALDYGTPPHGGIALGHDRIVALMAGESNIREVIAFPKTASAVDLMCDAPAPVDAQQIKELGLKVTND